MVNSGNGVDSSLLNLSAESEKYIVVNWVNVHSLFCSKMATLEPVFTCYLYGFSNVQD